MQVVVSGITVECVKGNIVRQEGIDAIVNAANAQLRMGGGVAGAIHRAAGPILEEECRPLAPIKPGDAVITGAGKLPNKYVIHTLGPVWGVDKPEEKILANCWRNSLLLADKNKAKSIAFPAISTGVFGYPVEEAAKVAIETIFETIPKLKNIKKIRIVLFSEYDFEIHKKILMQKNNDLQ